VLILFKFNTASANLIISKPFGKHLQTGEIRRRIEVPSLFQYREILSSNFKVIKFILCGRSDGRVQEAAVLWGKCA
jgi:hypothetical protein